MRRSAPIANSLNRLGGELLNSAWWWGIIRRAASPDLLDLQIRLLGNGWVRGTRGPCAPTQSACQARNWSVPEARDDPDQVGLAFDLHAAKDALQMGARGLLRHAQHAGSLIQPIAFTEQRGQFRFAGGQPPG